MCRELGFGYFSGFTLQARTALLEYHWPGNIRELKNVVERSVFRHSLEDEPVENIIINPFHAPWHDKQNNTRTTEDSTNALTTDVIFPMDLRQWQQDQEIEIMRNALEQAKFNQRKAAELLGLSYHQLRGLLRKYQLVGSNEE